jgi:hypothetical protein
LTGLFRRSLLAVLIVPLVLAPTGCKSRKKAVSNAASEPLPASTIFANDPQAAPHFVKGFYSIENNAWRWTGRTFAVSLAPPLHAAKNGAQLVVHLNVPDVVIQNRTSITLSASIQGSNLAAEQYTKGGQYTYLRDIPGERLQGAVVQVDFALDKAIAPSATDLRELGIIVNDIGLVAK